MTPDVPPAIFAIADAIEVLRGLHHEPSYIALAPDTSEEILAAAGEDETGRVTIWCVPTLLVAAEDMDGAPWEVRREVVGLDGSTSALVEMTACVGPDLQVKYRVDVPVLDEASS